MNQSPEAKRRCASKELAACLVCGDRVSKLIYFLHTYDTIREYQLLFFLCSPLFYPATALSTHLRDTKCAYTHDIEHLTSPRVRTGGGGELSRCFPLRGIFTYACLALLCLLPAPLQTRPLSPVPTHTAFQPTTPLSAMLRADLGSQGGLPLGDKKQKGINFILCPARDLDILPKPCR